MSTAAPIAGLAAALGCPEETAATSVRRAGSGVAAVAAGVRTALSVLGASSGGEPGEPWASACAGARVAVDPEEVMGALRTCPATALTLA